MFFDKQFICVCAIVFIIANHQSIFCDDRADKLKQSTEELIKQFKQDETQIRQSIDSFNTKLSNSYRSNQRIADSINTKCESEPDSITLPKMKSRIKASVDFGALLYLASMGGLMKNWAENNANYFGMDYDYTRNKNVLHKSGALLPAISNLKCSKQRLLKILEKPEQFDDDVELLIEYLKFSSKVITEFERHYDDLSVGVAGFKELANEYKDFRAKTESLDSAQSSD